MCSRAWVQITAATLSGNSLRQTVHNHRASVHQAAKLVAALLSVARVTAGLAKSNGSLPPGLWLNVTYRLTAKNRDQLQKPTLGNRVRATFSFFTTTARHLLDFMEQGKIIKAGTLTICLDVTTSRLSVSHLQHPPFLRRFSFLPQPSQFILAWDSRQMMLACIQISICVSECHSNEPRKNSWYEWSRCCLGYGLRWVQGTIKVGPRSSFPRKGQLWGHLPAQCDV